MATQEGPSGRVSHIPAADASFESFRRRLGGRLLAGGEVAAAAAARRRRVAAALGGERSMAQAKPWRRRRPSGRGTDSGKCTGRFVRQSRSAPLAPPTRPARPATLLGAPATPASRPDGRRPLVPPRPPRHRAGAGAAAHPGARGQPRHSGGQRPDGRPLCAACGGGARRGGCQAFQPVPREGHFAALAGARRRRRWDGWRARRRSILVHQGPRAGARCGPARSAGAAERA